MSLEKSRKNAKFWCTDSVGDAVTHVKVGSSLEDTDDNIPLRCTMRKIFVSDFKESFEIGKSHFIYGLVQLRVIVVGGIYNFLLSALNL